MWELKPQYSACKCQYLTRLTRFAPRLYSTQFLHLCKRLYNKKPKKVYPKCKINSIYWKVSNSVCYFHLLLLFTVHVKSISIVRPNSEGLAFQNASLWIRPLELDEELKVDEPLLGAYSQAEFKGQTTTPQLTYWWKFFLSRSWGWAGFEGRGCFQIFGNQFFRGLPGLNHLTNFN